MSAEATVRTRCANEKCGEEFDRPVFIVLGREFFLACFCPKCVRRHEEEELALKNRLAKQKLENAWRSLCPPRYRECDRNWLPLARDRIQLVADWRVSKSGRGLGLVGPAHIGKRRLLFSLGKDLFFLGIRIAHVTAIDFERLLFEQYDQSCGELAKAKLERLRGAQVLILSDLGTEKLTENSQTEFYSLIEHRAQNLLPILWTTQFSGDQLAAKFTSARRNVSELAEERGHSAIDRLVQISDVIQVERESFSTAIGTAPEACWA